MFVKMKGLCYQTFSSISSDETEDYPYPKRIKTENNDTSIEKEEQQQLEQRAYWVEECMESLNKPFYLSQGLLNFSQHVERLEKENSGRKRKTSTNEFIDLKPWINEKLQILENEQIAKQWNLENEDPNIIRDDSLLNVKEHSSEAGLYKTQNVFQNCKNIDELKQVQEKYSTYLEENNKKDNEFELNTSLPSLHTDLFQGNTSGQNVGTGNTWKELQLLDVPFLHGINSRFSEAENKERSNCLKEQPTEENKDHYGNDCEPVEQLDNKQKNVSSHIFPTIKSFKKLQTFQIPQTNFFMKGNMISFSNASNTLDSNMLSTNLKEIEQKNFKNQTYVTQSEKIYCSQNVSVAKKQKFQNDKNIENATNVCSEFNESNYVGKRKTWALGEEEEKTSETNFKGNLNSFKYNQMFAKANFKGKDLENTDGVEGQESNICLSLHICIGSRTPQSDECSNPANILKRTWGKVSYKDRTFNVQETTIPLISEILRNRDLNVYYDMYCANSDKNLHKSESKLCTTKTLRSKRYLSKNILSKNSCPYSTTQNLPVLRDIDNILKWKKLTILKILLHDIFGGLRAKPGTLNKDIFKYQEDNTIIACLHLYEKLKSIEQYNISEIITNNNNNKNYNTHIYLQATIAEDTNVNIIKSDLACFSYNVNHLHPAEEKCIPMEKNPLNCGKQVQSHINNSLKGNTEYQQKYITYPGICKEAINPKLVKTVGFQLHNKYQKIHYSSTAAEIKQVFFLHKRNLFLKQQRGLSEARCAEQYCPLSTDRKGIHDTFPIFDHEEKDSQMQLLVANTLISLRDNFDNSLVWKLNWCSTKKIQDLTEINLKLLNYLPSISKIKFEKLNSKCSILEMLLPTVKQKKKKKKQRKIHSIAFPKEKFRISRSVLCENKKHRSRGFTNSVNFAYEATILMPKCLRTSNKVNFYKKENRNDREFKRNSYSFLPKIPFFPVFDTYEKIPLSTEEMDQIPFVKVNSNNEKYIEEISVPSIRNVHNVPAKSNDVCILPELSISTENHNSELLQDNTRNKDKHSKELNTYHQRVGNEKTYVHFPNAGLNSGNIFYCFIDNGQFVTSPFYSCPFTDKDVRLKTEEGYCRNFLNNGTENLCEEMDKNLQYQILKSSRVSNNSICFKIQRKETMTFCLSEEVQTDRNFCTINSEPMSMKYNLKDLQEVGEINTGQNHLTNQNQHQTRLHGSRSTNLILSYSKDETAVSIASGDQLITHLSVMNSGCPEDVINQHLLTESKNISEFELKSKFDLVLEELCMFHEISKEHENKLAKVETNIYEENSIELNTEGIPEHLKSVSQTKANICFPICDTTAKQNIIKNKQISLKGDILSRNGKEEIPREFCSSSMSGEEFLYSLSEGDSVDSGCKNQFQWNPVFLSDAFIEERSYRLQKERGYCLSHEIIRVQPLKTCSRPIRIGLSRKAKPKKLHPYLK